MREILFRGKSKEPFRKKGEWVFGGVCDWDSGVSIFEVINDPGSNVEHPSTDVYEIEVEKESVGQFTGRIDKNGERLFEGDVVKVRCVWLPSDDQEDLPWTEIDDVFLKSEIPGAYRKTIENYGDHHFYRYFKNYQVVWSKKRLSFELKNGTEREPFIECQTLWIIGNVYDNPELLERSI